MSQVKRLPLLKIFIGGLVAAIVGAFIFWLESDVRANPASHIPIEQLNGLVGSYLGITLMVFGFGALIFAGLFANDRRKAARKTAP